MLRGQAGAPGLARGISTLGVPIGVVNAVPTPDRVTPVALLRRFRITDRRVDRGHHLLGHQLHRPYPQRLVFPVLAGIEQRPEIPGHFTKREKLVDDAARVAGDDEAVDDEVEGQLVIGEIALGLEGAMAVGLLELGEELIEVVPVRAPCIVLAIVSACQKIDIYLNLKNK